MNYMLETLDSPTATQGGENASAESISRKDIGWAWLAGAFEGEGCVFAYFKKQTNPQCRDRMTLTVGASIYNTHPMFIRKVTLLLVECGVKFSVVAGNRKTERPGAHITIQGKTRAAKFFNGVMPHLASKRKQVELALQLIAYRESLVERFVGRKGIFQKMTLLDDEHIKDLCAEIKALKRNYASVFDFSRQANMPFGESSETLRSSLGVIQ